MTSKYVVIQISTGLEVLRGATLSEAGRFCQQFRGRYFKPLWF